MQILKRLFKPDYDSSLINKYDISEAGSAYRMNQKWVTWPVTIVMILGMLTIALPVIGDCSPAFRQFVYTHEDAVAKTVAWILTPGIVFCAVVWFGSKRYAVNSRSVILANFRENAGYADNSMRRLPLAKMGDHPTIWSKMTLKEQREMVIGIFNGLSKPNEEMVNEFLELFKQEKIVYAKLPEWIAFRLILHPQIYYWYKERKERYEGYIINLQIS